MKLDTSPRAHANDNFHRQRVALLKAESRTNYETAKQSQIKMLSTMLQNDGAAFDNKKACKRMRKMMRDWWRGKKADTDLMRNHYYKLVIEDCNYISQEQYNEPKNGTDIPF